MKKYMRLLLQVAFLLALLLLGENALIAGWDRMPAGTPPPVPVATAHPEEGHLDQASAAPLNGPADRHRPVVAPTAAPPKIVNPAGRSPRNPPVGEPSPTPLKSPVFGILSLACAIASALMYVCIRLLPPLGIALLVALGLAILFGAIGSSKRRKGRKAALVGLGLGLYFVWSILFAFLIGTLILQLFPPSFTLILG